LGWLSEGTSSREAFDADSDKWHQRHPLLSKLAFNLAVAIRMPARERERLKLLFGRRPPPAASDDSASGGSDPHPFSADRPISSKTDDRLRRAGFAKALADAIRSWRGRDSLVIGLYGPWGSGKTSIINLALEQLSEGDPKPRVIQFNPWEWAGHEELATALFAEVAKALDQEKSNQASSLARRFREYAFVLNAGRSITGALAPIVAAISTVLVAVGIGVVEIGGVGTWPGGAVAVAGAVGVLLSQVKGVTEGLAAVLEKRSQWCFPRT